MYIFLSCPFSGFYLTGWIDPAKNEKIIEELLTFGEAILGYSRLNYGIIRGEEHFELIPKTVKLKCQKFAVEDIPPEFKRENPIYVAKVSVLDAEKLKEFDFIDFYDRTHMSMDVLLQEGKV